MLLRDYGLQDTSKSTRGYHDFITKDELAKNTAEEPPTQPSQSNLLVLNLVLRSARRAKARQRTRVRGESIKRSCKFINEDELA